MSPAVLTGSRGPARDFYSATNKMEVWLFTDSSGSGRGFRANFTSGVHLGSLGTGPGSLAAVWPVSIRQLSGSITVHVLCDQLPVPMVSSSAPPEAVSTVTGGATVRLTVLTPLMKQNVVGWGFLRPHLCRRQTHLHRHLSVSLQVNGSSRLQFQLGSNLLTACADTWTSRLSVFTCQYLGYRYLTCLHSPATPSESQRSRNEAFLDFICDSSGLETPPSSRLCRKIPPLQTLQSAATGA